ncbi:hypothetical protein CCACVL1_19058 [Corchorus capsularis]|uniref:Uncharacterized protein n=1 Tax=Corchorus capsularis TaxID=210143 RepID=A0A1R3HIS6_COCAP|nr:hypothetical protein CCACVL1_19058 [Corchorus capsularis]
MVPAVAIDEGSRPPRIVFDFLRHQVKEMQMVQMVRKGSLLVYS